MNPDDPWRGGRRGVLHAVAPSRRTPQCEQLGRHVLAVTSGCSIRSTLISRADAVIESVH